MDQKKSFEPNIDIFEARLGLFNAITKFDFAIWLYPKLGIIPIPGGIVIEHKEARPARLLKSLYGNRN